MSPSYTRVPAHRAIDRFAEAWDALVVAPPGQQYAAVLVLLTGEGESQPSTRTPLNSSLLHSLRARLVADDTALAPHALIEPRPAYGAGPATLLYDDITEDLDRTMPAGTGKLKFPSYWLLRDIVTNEELAERGTSRAREVRRAAYAEHLRRTSWARQHEQPREPTPGWLQPVKFVVELWTDWLAEPWFGYRTGRRMLRARNRNWYATWAWQLRGSPVRNFFASVQDLAPGGRNADSAMVDQALLRALLSDLDDAFRNRVLSPWRRRRVTRFVLLVEGAEPVDHQAPDALPGGPDGAPLQRFLTEYLVAAEELRSRSTLVVGCAQPEFAAELEAAPQADFEAAEGALRSGMRAQRGPVALTVPVRPEAEVAEWTARGQRKITPRFFRWGPVPGLALRCVMVTAVGATLIGGWHFTGFSPFSACPSGQFESRDRSTCLGVSDGTREFKGMPENFKYLFEKVATTNKEAGKSKGKNAAEVRTIVYFGPMTANAAGDSGLGGSLPELSGVAYSQHKHNEDVKRNGKGVQLKVLLANTGPLFEEAKAAAKEVVKMADEKNIVGVIGFGQSRSETYDAMKIIGEKGIPMVGTSATADSMLDPTKGSKLYYQLAPTNSRQAGILKAFLENEPLFPQGESEKTETADKALVVSDKDDEYSKNLADDFTKEFGKGKVISENYTPSKDDSPATLASNVCQEIKGKNIPIVWTARANELDSFYTQYQKTGCDGKLTVLGGDDVTNLSPESTQRKGLSLYHVTLTRAGSNGTNRAKEFVKGYDEFFNDWEDAGKNPQGSHSALGFDAVDLLSEAVNRARSKSYGDFRMDAVSVSLSSNFTTGYQAVTGFIAFEEEWRVPKNKAIYIVRYPNSSLSGSNAKGAKDPSVVLKCGNFGSEEHGMKWGPEENPQKYECPVDNRDHG
ncbi:ABC transporter substrate-binding protein [Streptomyces sp. NPDC048565]|uniref:ABC transporter substrate-binding protein n=1 Tax=Streptomyces sp. NPDC048565 TaxID=3155266 RepID=UPI003412BF81